MKIVAGEGKKNAKFWAPTLRGPHPSGPPPFGAPTGNPSAPPPDNPKFRFFFPLLPPSPHFRSFSLSLGSSRGIWWCLKCWCQLCTFGLAACRVKPCGFCTMSILICPKTSEKSMTNCKILLVSRKKTLNTIELHGKTLSPPPGPTSLGPHCFWVVICAICAAPDSAACCLLFLLLVFLLRLAAAAVFAAACACCCFWAVGPSDPPPLPPLQC